jgi:hypothetical protein
MKIRLFGIAAAVAPLIVASSCPPRVTLTPRSLTFSSQVVSSAGTTSTARTITLKNSGFGNLTINSIVGSGYYSQTNDCPSPLGPQKSCSINVKFAPRVVGVVNGAITIRDNASNSPQIVNLSGTGITSVAFSPNALFFGTVPMGTTTAAKTLTLTNNQSTSTTINSISSSGDYSQMNNCPVSLGAGASCTIHVRFHPTVAAFAPGAITVSTDAFPGTQPVGLSGSGSGSVKSHVAFTPGSLAFGNQQAGTKSGTKTVTVKNTSTTITLTVTSVTASGGYVATNSCVGKMIPPNGTCTVSVAFKPISNFATISYPGAITLFDSDGTSPQAIKLSGVGVPPVTASPASLNYGPVVLATSSTQAVTLTNNHNTEEALSVSTSGYYNLSSNSCASPVPAGGTCNLAVTFVPSNVFGHINGAVTIRPSTDGFLSPAVASLTACATIITFLPPSLSFGSEPIGTTSSPLTATLTNKSLSTVNIDIPITGASITGSNAAEFAISKNTCGTDLPPGSSCMVSVTFTPTATGTKTGVLNMRDGDACSPQKVKLTGTGT